MKKVNEKYFIAIPEHELVIGVLFVQQFVLHEEAKGFDRWTLEKVPLSSVYGGQLKTFLPISPNISKPDPKSKTWWLQSSEFENQRHISYVLTAKIPSKIVNKGYLLREKRYRDKIWHFWKLLVFQNCSEEKTLLFTHVATESTDFTALVPVPFLLLCLGWRNRPFCRNHHGSHILPILREQVPWDWRRRNGQRSFYSRHGCLCSSPGIQ